MSGKANMISSARCCSIVRHFPASKTEPFQSKLKPRFSPVFKLGFPSKQMCGQPSFVRPACVGVRSVRAAAQLTRQSTCFGRILRHPLGGLLNRYEQFPLIWWAPSLLRFDSHQAALIQPASRIGNPRSARISQLATRQGCVVHHPLRSN